MNTRTATFLVLLSAGLIASCGLLGQGAPADLPRVTLPGARPLVYSARAYDPWNTIFYFLFSRRLQVRLSQDFPEGAPYVDLGIGTRVSKNLFERDETGDRATDPLYPTFSVGFGGMLVLRDPAYAEFAKSLRSALEDNSPRPAVARAMMQSDLWAAYDQLYFRFLPDDEKVLGERRKVVLDLIGRLIRKVALTSDEIKALPENYSAVVSQRSFPDVFNKSSDWVEVKWMLPRDHDDEAGYRRVSRVFLKPAHAPRDMNAFLNSLPATDPQKLTVLDGVALITQILLINSHGQVQPTKLTFEAQVRLFDRSHEGKEGTSLKVCEISRKLLLENPGSGGLVSEGEAEPAYFGGYRFAEGQITTTRVLEPVQVRLRTRCVRCHDDDLALVRTFAMIQPPHAHMPPVKQLDPAKTEVADFDIAISAKRKENTLQALLPYFR